MANRGHVAGIPARRARSIVEKIARQHFGSAPRHIRREAGGLTNLVYHVESRGAEYIFRLNGEPAKLNPFRKEQRVTQRVREAGVPVPEVLAVGSDPLPYMILRKIAGQPATSHPERGRILCELGRLAAVINSLHTTGYGTTFDWLRQERSSCKSWHEFLENEYDLEARLGMLRRRRVLPEKKISRVRSILRSLGSRRRKPVLNHGDLRLKNVLVNEKGQVAAILDWETCTSNLAPEWEVSTALHDLSIDEKESFLEGYGLSAKEVTAMAPVVKAFNIVNYFGAIEKHSKGRGTGELERYRVRLSGALDLYCL